MEANFLARLASSNEYNIALELYMEIQSSLVQKEVKLWQYISKLIGRLPLCCFQKDNFQRIRQKHGMFRSGPHALLLLKKCCIYEDIHFHIYGALAQRNLIMSYKRYMREYVEITQVKDRYWEKHSKLATIGQPYKKDAHDLIKACDRCQRFANDQTRQREPMTPITTPWPFAQWGIDIMGPFLPRKKQVKFLIIAIDYFTK